jgi:hypothetical protein
MEQNIVLQSTNKEKLRADLRTQRCLVCKTLMGDMPGSRDAYCARCGFKDPCCE